jgi:nucleotide-binding universal stress UspA family protein
MLRYEKIGLLLTGLPADETALGFAGAFAQLAACRQLLCVYAEGIMQDQPGETPDAAQVEQGVLERLPEPVRPLVELRVLHGRADTELLRIGRDADLDLMIKGRPLPSSQTAAGAKLTRLARKAPCTVLVVPCQVRPHHSRLLVPVDFSEHSKMAVETALEIARASAGKDGQPQVLVQTIFSVGYGYTKAGVDFHEAARNIEAASRCELDRFLAGLDTSGVEFQAVCTCSEQTPESVHELAAVRKMDMIVVGSRGLSRSAAAILGSTAERILTTSPLPVLIVKRKGETMHLLDALLGGR